MDATQFIITVDDVCSASCLSLVIWCMACADVFHLIAPCVQIGDRCRLGPSVIGSVLALERAQLGACYCRTDDVCNGSCKFYGLHNTLSVCN
ncbi:hypothetical protein V6N13_063751 [Hibiscus sabdariffa]